MHVVDKHVIDKCIPSAVRFGRHFLKKKKERADFLNFGEIVYKRQEHIIV